MTARSLLLLPLLLTAACAGGGDDGGTTDTDIGDTDVGPNALVGTWAVGDGGVFDALGIGAVGYLEVTAGPGRDAGYLVFHAEEADTHALNCPQRIWSVGPGGAMIVSTDGGESGAGTTLYLLDVTDADTLALSDISGRSATLTRTDAVPGEAVCGTIGVDADTLFDLSADGWGNLLWDGTRLLVPVDAGGVVPLDLAAGTYGSPLDFGSSYEHLHVMQGADGWGHCACGNSEEVARVGVGGGVVDMVRTSDLGTTVSFRGAALDGDTLIVGGSSYDDRQSHLLRIDTSGEPDVLLADLVSPFGSNTLAWHDGGLLAVQGNRLVRVGSDGLAEATWQLPPAYGDTWWRQVASDGTHVYLGGQPPSGVGHRVLTLTLE